ncbi:MAG: peptide chain release factor-like protein [Acidimicrobiia bacterium]
MEISPLDLEIDIYRGSLNDSAVRITHLPSGVCVSSDNLPTQQLNYEAAMRLLREQLGE